MQYKIRITNTFLLIIEAILDDARAYAAGVNPAGDETLDGLAELDRQMVGSKAVRGGIEVVLDEVALAALRAEAVYRVEWADDAAGDCWGDDALRWLAWGRSAQSMVNRVDKVRAVATV